MRVVKSTSPIQLAGWIGGLSLAILVIGCGPGVNPDAPETAPVQGTVMYQGKPLAEGVVRFNPQGTEGNPGSGMIQPDGTFQLSTYSRHDGAVLGKHKVTIEIPLKMDGSTPDPPIQLPKAYGDIENTPLEVTVEGGETNQVKLEIVE